MGATNSPDEPASLDSSPLPSNERVGVLVVNRNNRDYLLRALDHVFASTYPPVFVVVADDQSTDDSVAAVRERFPNVSVLTTKQRRGAPGIRNDGLRVLLQDAAIRYVLFLDNDAFVQPEALAEMVSAAQQDASIGVVAPKAFRNRNHRILYSAGELRVSFYTGIVRDAGAGVVDTGQYNEARPIQACASFAMLVRREALEACKGFDEAFYPYGWEDVDFTLRVKHHGFTVWYAPAAEVEHLGGKAGRGPRLDYEIAKARNLFRLMARHANLLQWLCFLLVLPWRTMNLLINRITSRGTIGTR